MIQVKTTINWLLIQISFLEINLKQIIKTSKDSLIQKLRICALKFWKSDANWILWLKVGAKLILSKLKENY